MTLARSETGKPAYAVIGATTTGLSPTHDVVEDLAIVRIDEAGGLVDEWTTTLDDGTFAHQGMHVRNLLSQMAVVTHNDRLAVEMLRRSLTRSGWDVPSIAQVTTLEASFTYLPRLNRRRLGDCCTAAGVPGPDGTAAGQAHATAQLLVRFIAGAPGVAAVQDLTGVTLRAWVYPWPEHPTRGAVPQRATRHSARPVIPSVRLEHLNSRQLADGADGTFGHERAYLTLLADALAGGRILDPDPGLHDVPPVLRTLGDVATLLHVPDLARVHRMFINALVAQAIDEDRYAQEIRQELFRLATLLGVPWSVILEPIVEATPLDFPKVVDNTGAAPTPAAPAGVGPTAIRAWAAEAGYVIDPEEKIPWNVVRAFEEAQKEQN